MSVCRQCSVSYDVTQEDLAFYDRVSPVFQGRKYSIPPPTLCPECRMQRRFAYRNERSLFQRKCDLTGKELISMYPPHAPFPVYEKIEWYGDKWDPLEYGRSFDFSRPFFEQFAELKGVVPRMSLVQQAEMPNAEYCNRASQCKNCYLLFSSSLNEDCYYGTNTNDSKNCVDGYNVQHCELCYEAVDCYDCYRCFWCESCTNCSDSAFLKSCTGCKHCLLCTNLVQKEYHISNKPCLKEKYEEELHRISFSTYAATQSLRAKFHGIKQHMIVKEFTGIGNENISGNCLNHCKNTFYSFDCKEVEDSKYLQSIVFAKDCMDYSYWGRNTELAYEVHGTGYSCRSILFCNESWEGNEGLILCDSCMHSSQLFGCIGLRHKQYCIFNKQCSKEEYEVLVPKIIAHMQKTNEYGEFFPLSICHFAYNETVAQDYFPLSEEEVLARGWKWLPEDIQRADADSHATSKVPETLQDCTDNLCKEVFACEGTGKPFRVLPQELRFYRSMNIAPPHLCPDERHRRRLALRNPRKLWSRSCAKCGKGIQTSYSPERTETVCCEKCYLQEVY